MTTNGHPEHIYGTFRFIDPDLSVPASERAIYAGPAPKTVKEEVIKLNDFRTSNDIARGFAGLDTQAFTFIEHEFSLSGDELLEGTNAEDIYAGEVVEMMLKLTGAKRAVVHNICFRRKLADMQEDLWSVRRKGDPIDHEVHRAPKDRVLVNGRDEYTSEPARHAHCDMTLPSLQYTLRVCREDIREAAKDFIEAETLREQGAVVRVPRYAAYSIWRPLKTVKRDPIAVLDYRSIDKSELAMTDFRVTSQLTENGEYIAHAWLHVPPKDPSKLKWYWMPEQKPNEICIIKFTDSASAEDPNIADGCIHCSPQIPGTETEECRQSVETRVYCFWD